ncbi:MAG: MarR family transcriptional regulator, lower aerobic nicotinate degradation pathway regulator [Gaiellaceae bacterium]|nr:MarR family transcriptional regulator, lower aerobic nicotinate degradation pathway regulator [Gaiellaceae bacterium]
MTTPVHSHSPAPVLKPGVKAPYELRCSPVFLLKRLGMLAKERTMEAYEAIGASPYHYSVLAVLEEGARDTQAKIADALGLDRSWLVGLLDELEEAGLIERKRDPEDRRRHLVSLNASGKERLAELREISKSVENELLAALDPEQRAQLHELLLQLAADLDPRYAPADGETTPAI